MRGRAPTPTEVMVPATAQLVSMPAGSEAPYPAWMARFDEGRHPIVPSLSLAGLLVGPEGGLRSR